MHKLGLGITLALTSLLVVGCGAPAATKSAHKADAPTHQEAKRKHVTPKKKVAYQQLQWDTARRDALQQYMAQFGPVMNQQYVMVDKQSTTAWYDQPLGQYMTAKRSVMIDGVKTAVTWLPEPAKGNAKQPNVVAVYADTNAHILYCFALTGKQPHVYVSQAAPGDDGLIGLKETANQDLTAAFSAIVAGKTASVPKATVATTQESKENEDDTAESTVAALSQFPKNMQGTWYGVSYGKLYTLSIAGNKLTQGDMTQEAHPLSERTEADNKASMSLDENSRSARQYWIELLIDPPFKDGDWIDVYGWYQSAGAGSFYRVIPRTLDGQRVNVMDTASGAGQWLDCHFYPTKEMAYKYKDLTFPEDNFG